MSASSLNSRRHHFRPHHQGDSGGRSTPALHLAPRSHPATTAALICPRPRDVTVAPVTPARATTRHGRASAIVEAVTHPPHHRKELGRRSERGAGQWVGGANGSGGCARQREAWAATRGAGHSRECGRQGWTGATAGSGCESERRVWKRGPAAAARSGHRSRWGATAVEEEAATAMEKGRCGGGRMKQRMSSTAGRAAAPIGGQPPLQRRATHGSAGGGCQPEAGSRGEGRAPWWEATAAVGRRQGSAGEGCRRGAGAAAGDRRRRGAALITPEGVDPEQRPLGDAGGGDTVDGREARLAAPHVGGTTGQHESCRSESNREY